MLVETAAAPKRRKEETPADVLIDAIQYVHQAQVSALCYYVSNVVLNPEIEYGKTVHLQDFDKELKTNISALSLSTGKDGTVLTYSGYNQNTVAFNTKPMVIYSVSNKDIIEKHMKGLFDNFTLDVEQGKVYKTTLTKESFLGFKSKFSYEGEDWTLAESVESVTDMGPNLIKNSTVDWKIGLSLTCIGATASSVSFSVDTEVSLIVPNSIGYWATNSNAKTFKPYMFYMWLQQFLSEWQEARSNSVITAPFPFSDPTELSIALRKLGPIAAPRTNKEGICFTRNGDPIWVPAEDNTAELSRLIDAAYDRSSGQITSDPLKAFRGRLLLTDWVNNKVFYVSEGKAKIETIDLVGSIIADAANVHLMSTSANGILYYKPWLERTCRVIDESGLFANVKWTRNFKLEEKETAIGEDSLPFNSASSLLTLLYGTINEHALTGLPLSAIADGGESHKVDLTTHMRLVWLSDLMKYARINHTKLKVSEYGKMRAIMPMIWLAGMDREILKTNQTAFFEEHQKSTRSGSPVQLSVPNFVTRPGKFEGFMPHQAATLDGIGEFPRAALLAIDTGGGKTILLEADALRALAANVVKRALIITKRRLVAAAISEINTVTNGQVNAVPLTPEGISRMIDANGSRFASLNDIIAWITNMPPNTLFVTGYSCFTSTREFFDTSLLPSSFFNETLDLTQFLFIIIAAGFDYTTLDESTMIKNPRSQRTINTLNVTSRARYRRCASGTTLHNNVYDTIGPYSILNPVLFGTKERFEAEYSVSHGIVENETAAKAIRTRQKQLVNVQVRSELDWAWLLPIGADSYEKVYLTDVQTKFYDHLMEEAHVVVSNLLKDKRARNEESDDSGDDEEEDDSYAAVVLQASLARVEQFIAAPDADADFFAWLDNNNHKVAGKQDLISPHVAAVDAKIDEHLATGEGKIIIFGYHRAVTRHIKKHSRYSNQLIHYTAGDEEALRIYKTDPNVKILLADETALREGENMQMTGLILRVQTPWSSGDYSQARARMFRPDPRGVYNRDKVFHITFLTFRTDNTPTFDVAKFARMTSKRISNARVTYGGLPEFKPMKLETFDGLSQVKMSLDLIFEGQLNGPTNKPHDQLGRYLDAFDTFTERFNSAMQIHRLAKIKQLEVVKNVKLLDANGRTINTGLVAKHAMVPVDTSKKLANSQTVWAPWEKGVNPSVPEIGAMEIAFDAELSPAQYVYTEYGPGRIDTVGVKFCTVNTAIGKIKVPRNLLAVATTEHSQTALFEQSRILNKSARLPAGMKLVTTSLGEKISPTGGKPTSSGKAPVIQLEAGLLNGAPALMVKNLDEITRKKLAKQEDWNTVGAYYQVRVRNTIQAAELITRMMKKFALKSDRSENLKAQMAAMKQGKTLYGRDYPTSKKFREFFGLDHKPKGKLNGKYVMAPYIVAYGDKTYLALDADTHNANVIKMFRSLGAEITGKPVELVDNLTYLKTTSLSEIKDAIKDLGNQNIVNEEKLAEEFDELKILFKQIRKSKVEVEPKGKVAIKQKVTPKAKTSVKKAKPVKKGKAKPKRR